MHFLFKFYVFVRKIVVTPVSAKKSLFKSPAAIKFDQDLSLQETENMSCSTYNENKNTGLYF